MKKRKLGLLGVLAAAAMFGGSVVAASGEDPGKHPGPGPGASFGCAGPEKPASCPSGKK